MSGGYGPSRARSTKSAEDRYRERRLRRQSQLAVASVFPISVDMIMDRDNLVECYRELQREGGAAPGVDQVRFADLSLGEASQILADLSIRIRTFQYDPQPTRPVEIPKPGTTKTRTLAIPTIMDRAIAKAVHRAFEPYWERIFLECSWGFRPSRSTWGMLLAIEHAIRETGRTVLAVDDLKGAFDSVPLSAVRDVHLRLLEQTPAQPLSGRAVINRRNEKNNVLHLVMAVLSGMDAKQEVGIAQGNNYSPTALNAVLHYLLDLPLTATISSPLWFRYADNLCYLARSVFEGQQVLADIRQRLAPMGMSLKGEDGMLDLRTNEAQLLGFRIKYRDGRLICGLCSRTHDRLREDLRKAYDEIHPHLTACQVLKGWINSYGPAFENGTADSSVVLQIAAELGFRELASQESIQQWMQEAGDLWRVFRQRNEHHGADGG
jgi:RNA-directed DNA polymerase